MVAFFAMPASAAVTNKFGGYMETVFSGYKHLNYVETGSEDWHQIRYRHRLFYSATVHENLKFNFASEIDTVWGDTVGGDIGADGNPLFEIKTVNVDFNLMNTRWQVGTQGFNIARGLVINDDATGMKISYRGMDNIIPAFWWFRPFEGSQMDTGNNGADVDHFTVLANIKSGNMQFIPAIGYLTSNSAGPWSNQGVMYQAMNVYFVTLDFNAKFDMWDLTLFGGYEGGELNDTTDISAYAFNAKAGVKLANFKIRGEILYTTGEEATASGDYDGWWYPKNNGSGQNYSTAEFFRKGWDWTYSPKGGGAADPRSTGNAAENRMEFGLGVDFNPTKSWKVMFDWWNLNLTEDNKTGNSDVGNELDLKATWQIMKNLKLDLIGAYLILGDAIKPATDDANPYETSIRLILSY